MAAEQPQVLQCGDGWCVKTPTGMEGPLDSQYDAARYLNLLETVKAARTEMACMELECS